MAAKDRRKTFDLENFLLNNYKHIGFIQSMRLLRILSESNYNKQLFDSVRIRPDLAMHTPPEEITNIIKFKNKDYNFLVTATFLEMYGAGSPLPMFYTQELIKEQNHNYSISRDFIDIFNTIFYEHYFKIWKKHTLFFNLFESPDKSLWTRLFCISGLGIESMQSMLSNPQAMIAFSGLLFRQIRTAEGLRTILKTIFPSISFEIEQCIYNKAVIPQSQKLFLGKSGNSLGNDTYLGKYIYDKMGMFRIHIGPIALPGIYQFMPDQKGFALIEEVIRFYIDQPLKWDIEIACSTAGMNTVNLSSEIKIMLGWNTWIFSGDQKPDMVKTRFRQQPSAYYAKHTL